MLPAVITIPIDPGIGHLGPLTFRWYGVAYAAGLVVGAWVATRHLVRRGVDVDAVFLLLLGIIVAALAGARVAYVVQSDLGSYFAHPQLIVVTWHGGMATSGAVIASLAAGIVLSRQWRVDTWLAIDGAALLTAAAMPIWDLGRVVDGELVGSRSSLPWATRYTNPASLAPHLGVAYQPAAAYEALGLLCVLAALLLLRRRGAAVGMVGIAYVGLYSATELLFSFLQRTEPPLALGLETPQLETLGMLVLGLPTLALLRSRAAKPSVPFRIPQIGTQLLLRAFILGVSPMVDAVGPTRVRRHVHRLRARTVLTDDRLFTTPGQERPPSLPPLQQPGAAQTTRESGR